MQSVAEDWYRRKKEVDEMECKAFIKRSDSNLLSIRREAAAARGPPVLWGYSVNSRRRLWNFALKLWELQSCSGDGQTFCKNA